MVGFRHDNGNNFKPSNGNSYPNNGQQFNLIIGITSVQ